MEEFAQAFFEAFGIEVAFDQSAVADGDDAGFFTDHDDDGIGFLGESECGAMAGSESAIDVDALADGKNTGGSEDSGVAENQASIVERGFGKEDADSQFGGESAVDGDAGFGERLEAGIAFDGEECAELAVG